MKRLRTSFHQHVKLGDLVFVVIACSPAAREPIPRPLHHTALASECIPYFSSNLASLVVCSPGAPGAPKPAPNPLQSTGTLSFAAIANSGLRPAEALTIKAPEGVRAPLQTLTPYNFMYIPNSPDNIIIPCLVLVHDCRCCRLLTPNYII